MHLAPETVPVSSLPMRTPSKKRSPSEMEPVKDKAPEMKETPEEEVREGTETEDGEQYAKKSRKRSAKGAKNTKAPMDAECGCGGKGRKGKAACDGSCGGSAKKMDRNDALTPQEYLAACDLGIQGRDRSYIRARLDAAKRLDLKCGKGAISEGEKCTKGPAQKVQPNARRGKRPSGRAKVRGLKTAAKVALVAGAALGAGLAGKAVLNKATSIAASRNKTQIRAMSANRQAAWQSVWETNAAANKANLFQRGKAQANYQNARDNLYNSIDSQRREIARMKRFAPKSAARKRAAAKRDSIWATGFEP